MAKIILSAIVTGIKGKMGGTIFQNSYTGYQAKNLARVRDPKRAVQALRRTSLSEMATAWGALSDIDRAAWNEFPFPGMSGYNSFVRANTVMASIGEPMIPAGGNQVALTQMPMLITAATVSTLTIHAGSTLDVVPADQSLSVRCTRPQSPGRTFIPQGEFVQVAVFPAATDFSGNVSIFTDYVSVLGTPLVGKKIWVQTRICDIVFGGSMLSQRNNAQVT